MHRIQQLADFLEAFAPAALAESWDNVGLLVGDLQASVQRVMTCLTITPLSAKEAIDRQADLIVTHHPLPFRPLKQLTRATPEGSMLLDLIAAQIGIYSPHTAFDSAAAGINQRLAEGLGLSEIQPLQPQAEGTLGSGRFGRLSIPIPVAEFALRVKQFLSANHVQYVGNTHALVSNVAVGCGSAGEFLSIARAKGCDCLLTGEARFHTALEAEATNISLVLAGHFASERFAVEALAKVLQEEFPAIEVWASTQEADPLRTV